MERLADLHVHTNHSDSTFSPKTVVEYAKQKGLSCIAITDHDSVDGIEPAMRAARKLDLEIIPGVEMTVQEDGVEIHILGFFVDLKDTRFLKKLKKIRRNRVQRIYKIINKLKRYNVDIDPEEVFKLSGPGSVGRPHIAAVMEKKGYVSSIEEAFRRFLGDHRPCFEKHFEITAEEAISELKAAGAVTVYAHPHVMGGERFVVKLIKYGLEGIEAYHSEHSRSVARRYVEIATKHDLLVTGGSDCHGLNKDKILIGTVTVPYKLVEELKDACQR